jgi:hypothetical protein
VGHELKLEGYSIYPKRAGQRYSYKEILACYNKQIRKAKRSSWKRYCYVINDNRQWQTHEIIEKQATNRVSTIKQPDDQ